jgi:S1-C subfamily serine protease
MTVKAINQFDNPDLFFHRNKGVFIFGTKYPGNASSGGLQPKDIILKIDGKDVATLEEVKGIYRSAVANLDKSHKVVVSVLRNGLLIQVVLDFSRDYQKE